MCPDCLNAHELLRNVAFDGHKVRAIKHFQTEDYEALLKRQSFCSQQYHEREVTRFFCLECRTCVCQVCVVTDHRNHAVDPLDKAADHEKAKIMAGTELMKEKGKIYGDVIRELEKTIFVLETNISAAKREVSETAEQIIAKVRERERELITTLEDTRVIRTKKLNSLKTQVQSLVKQINQAIEFAEKLVQQSASSDIMQSKKSLEKRFEDLIETSVPTVPFSLWVKFVSTFEPDSLTLGFVKNSERVVEGLEQEFQAGVEAELIFCPKLTDETEGSFGLDVNIKPAEKVGSLVTSKRRDGTFQVRFTTKVPGTYSIQGYENIGDFTSWSIFFGLAQVKQRRLEVREFDLNGEFQPRGIAVNSNKGLIAVTDVNGHCILLLDKEGNFLRKFGCKGTDIGQLNSPSDITFLNDSEILVAEELNHRIQQFNVHTGKGVKTFGKHGEGVGEFRNPTGVYRDGEERIFVADFNNSRIQVFTKEVEPVFSFGSGLLRGPTACVVHQNMFIVSDASSQCLKIFDNSGNFLYMIGGKGRADGQLQWPGSLCIEKSGNHHNILVCDYNSHRIIQFTVEGSFTGKTIRKLQNPMCIAVTEDGRILVTCSRAPKIFILQ